MIRKPFTTPSSMTGGLRWLRPATVASITALLMLPLINVASTRIHGSSQTVEAIKTAYVFAGPPLWLTLWGCALFVRRARLPWPRGALVAAPMLACSGALTALVASIASATIGDERWDVATTLLVGCAIGGTFALPFGWFLRNRR